MEFQTATYQGHGVEILEETIRLNFGRIRQMSYIRLLDDAHILGTCGMWGGCEQAQGWIDSGLLHNRRVETLPDDLPIGDAADDELTDEVIFDRTEYRQRADTYAMGMGA